MAGMDTSQLELLRTDEMDIALRLCYLQHSTSVDGGTGMDEKEARKKEKRQQKDAKVCLKNFSHRQCNMNSHVILGSIFAGSNSSTLSAGISSM